MSRFVRQSKYRHVFGQASKKENNYDNIKVSASAWDTNLVTVNPLFMAVNCQVSGGGAFVVVPLAKTGKVPDIYPLVRGHSAPVLDTAWSPFDDHLVASGGEDSRVQLTRIDESALEAAWIEGATVEDIKPIVTNLGHGGRKVGHVQWHPTASGILASASYDIKLWDVEKQTAAIELVAHPDVVQSMTFNSTGALMATTCRDKKLRLFDVRASSNPVSIADSHNGVKGSRVTWCGTTDRIVTTGFSRTSERQLYLWDAGKLEKPLKQISVDTSSGTLMPFWSDNGVLFVAGKGDGNVRYYELENDNLLYLAEYKSSDPQRGMTFLPRRGLNVHECEIARAYKVSSNSIEPISFIVPRKSESFQSDIFPPAPSDKPALSASEFLSGQTKGPMLLDLESMQTSAPSPAAVPTYTNNTSSPTFTASPVQSRQPTKQSSLASEKSIAVESPVPSPAPSKQSSFVEPKSSPVPLKSPEPSPMPSPSPVVESASPEPQSEVATPAAAPSSSDSDISKLLSEKAALEEELAEAHTIIRSLELKVEKLTIAQKKALDAFAAV